MIRGEQLQASSVVVDSRAVHGESESHTRGPKPWHHYIPPLKRFLRTMNITALCRINSLFLGNSLLQTINLAPSEPHKALLQRLPFLARFVFRS